MTLSNYSCNGWDLSKLKKYRQGKLNKDYVIIMKSFLNLISKNHMSDTSLIKFDERGEFIRRSMPNPVTDIKTRRSKRLTLQEHATAHI